MRSIKISMEKLLTAGLVGVLAAGCANKNLIVEKPNVVVAPQATEPPKPTPVKDLAEAVLRNSNSDGIVHSRKITRGARIYELELLDHDQEGKVDYNDSLTVITYTRTGGRTSREYITDRHVNADEYGGIDHADYASLRDVEYGFGMQVADSEAVKARLDEWVTDINRSHSREEELVERVKAEGYKIGKGTRHEEVYRLDLPDSKIEIDNKKLRMIRYFAHSSEGLSQGDFLQLIFREERPDPCNPGTIEFDNHPHIITNGLDDGNKWYANMCYNDDPNSTFCIFPIEKNISVDFIYKGLGIK